VADRGGHTRGARSSSSADYTSHFVPQLMHRICVTDSFRDSPVARSERPPVRMAPVALPPLTPRLALMDVATTVPDAWQCGHTRREFLDEEAAGEGCCSLQPGWVQVRHLARTGPDQPVSWQITNRTSALHAGQLMRLAVASTGISCAHAGQVT
jgi:hypothetical protein